jgi:hypothetical protein
MNTPVDWLLQGEPYIEYHTRRRLLGESEQQLQVKAARRAMLASPAVQALLSDLADWPKTVIASHKSAGQPFHKLTFLADLGLTVEDAGIEPIVARILAHKSEEGPFHLPMTTPGSAGGEGQTQWAWALCDAPLVVYALAKFGLTDHPAAQAATTHLVHLVRDNGWPCAVSKTLGKWRGPGRKADPCPYANLAMLKALSAIAPLRDSPGCRTGAETLLALWHESASQHPYMFFMGTDFRKIKVPLVWYDLIHVLDVLSNFAWLKQDPRLHDMLGVLKSKADLQGCFTIESVWTAWKDWEFGQKKVPSRWLTLNAWQIINRIEQSS